MYRSIASLITLNRHVNKTLEVVLVLPLYCGILLPGNASNCIGVARDKMRQSRKTLIAFYITTCNIHSIVRIGRHKEKVMTLICIRIHCFFDTFFSRYTSDNITLN